MIEGHKYMYIIDREREREKERERERERENAFWFYCLFFVLSFVFSLIPYIF